MLLVLHACVVVTCVLELPTCVSLGVGRIKREPLLTALITQSLTNITAATLGTDAQGDASPPPPLPPPVLVMPSPPPPPPPPFEFRPDLLPQMALESGGGFFSTDLSAQQLGFWQGLIVVRAIFSTVAWLLACLMQSHLAFGVPPIAEGSVGGGYGSW